VGQRNNLVKYATRSNRVDIGKDGTADGRSTPCGTINASRVGTKSVDNEKSIGGDFKLCSRRSSCLRCNQIFFSKVGSRVLPINFHEGEGARFHWLGRCGHLICDFSAIALILCNKSAMGSETLPAL
jgi:hypothetical protein